MQFREVKGRIQALASVWDGQRSRQVMIHSLRRYGGNERVTVESLAETLEKVPVEKRQQMADEINAHIEHLVTASAESRDRYTPLQTRSALRDLVALLERDPSAADEGLDDLAGLLRQASKLVGNRARGLKLKAARAARAAAKASETPSA